MKLGANITQADRDLYFQTESVRPELLTNATSAVVSSVSLETMLFIGGGGRERPVQRQHERRKSRCVEVKARNLAVGASKGRDMVDAIKKGKVDIVFGQK